MVPSPDRLAVIGLGVMGERHARCIAAHPRAVLSAVVEIDAARRDAAVKEFKCAAYETADEIIGRADAAVVAVPTALHADIAAKLLAARIACLVEKPFVSSRGEAVRVAAAAQAGGRVLQVGHIERFNPAVAALLERVDPAAIRTITARRISAASARVTDIDVVMDLMVHDIDVALALKQQPVASVTATGSADHAQAVLTFRDGTTADITASRTQPGRIRDLRATTDGATFEMDYIARTLTERKADVATALPVPAADALTSQLSAFLEAMKGGKPVVSAADGIAVMDVAWRIQAALGIGP